MPVNTYGIWEKRLWLADSSVDNLYRQKQARMVSITGYCTFLRSKVLSIESSNYTEKNSSYSLTTTDHF